MGWGGVGAWWWCWNPTKGGRRHRRGCDGQACRGQAARNTGAAEARVRATAQPAPLARSRSLPPGCHTLLPPWRGTRRLATRRRLAAGRRRRRLLRLPAACLWTARPGTGCAAGAAPERRLPGRRLQGGGRSMHGPVCGPAGGQVRDVCKAVPLGAMRDAAGRTAACGPRHQASTRASLTCRLCLAGAHPVGDEA